MRFLITIIFLICVGFCLNASGIVFTFYGQVVDGFPGVPLEPVQMGPNGDYEYVGVNPLVQILLNGGVVAETTVGAGMYELPVEGNFYKEVNLTGVREGDVFECRAYSSPTEWGSFGESEGQTYTYSLPVPSDFIFDFGTIHVLIPEPSLIIPAIHFLLIYRRRS